MGEIQSENLLAVATNQFQVHGEKNILICFQIQHITRKEKVRKHNI